MTVYNDTQHNAHQNNDTQRDATQYNEEQNSDTQHRDIFIMTLRLITLRITARTIMTIS